MAVVRAYDAAVIGAGPNGLAAAITLARAGRSVTVYEAKETVGGGCRSAELTLPGFVHDICAAVHPLGIGSPFMRNLPLDQFGLEWVHPDAPLAHPLDDGTAVMLEHSIAATTANLGRDSTAYARLIEPLAARWDDLVASLLGPLRPPRHPVPMARFGLSGLRSIQSLVDHHFQSERARALFAGVSAHAILPLDRSPGAAFGLVLMLFAHTGGWPVARGGSQHVVNAMAAYLRSLGGEIVTNAPVTSLDDLPPVERILCDVTPRQLLAMAGERFPARYRRQLGRYRYGPGVFKLDLALDGPIPWKAKECLRAGTVHAGGTFEQIAESEGAVWRGAHPERPLVLVAQQSLFDPSRAPEGKQTVWAYCHVPAGSTVNMTSRIEAQIERFAPGFRERILARHTMTAAQFEAYNPNDIGGDINGGVQDLWQLFTRPTIQSVPYATPDSRVLLCSASTPPGGGVHGMCGYYAAQVALYGGTRMLLAPLTGQADTPGMRASGEPPAHPPTHVAG